MNETTCDCDETCDANCEHDCEHDCDNGCICISNGDDNE